MLLTKLGLEIREFYGVCRIRRTNDQGIQVNKFPKHESKF